MIQVPYVLLDGAGNRLACVDARGGLLPAASSERSRIAAHVCGRDDIRADSLLVLDHPDSDAPSVVGVDVYNADGSAAEMCGNGLRGVAMMLVDAGEAPPDQPFFIDTGAGPVVVRHRGRRGDDDMVEVDMGYVDVGPDAVGLDRDRARIASDGAVTIDLAGDATLTVQLAVVGNPHAIWIVERVAEIDLARIGPVVERHPAFPDRINLQAVEIVDRTRIVMRSWERGAGATAACGSGACAAATVLHRVDRVDASVVVAVPGGELAIDVTPEGRTLMTGPARELDRGAVGVPNRT